MTLKAHPLFGLGLAGFGALTLTPDALFIRLSGMGVWEMMVWRGSQLALVMYALVLITSWDKKAEIFKKTFSWRGLGVSLCQFTSNVAFIVGIAQTSVSVILFALATSPIFGAYFSRLILRERTHLSTWLATAATLIGIAITVADASHATAAPDGSVLFGAICGLTASAAIGLNFVLLRKRDDLPVAAIVGTGSLWSGLAGLCGHWPFNLARWQLAHDFSLWPDYSANIIFLPDLCLTLYSSGKYRSFDAARDDFRADMGVAWCRRSPNNTNGIWWRHCRHHACALCGLQRANCETRSLERRIRRPSLPMVYIFP